MWDARIKPGWAAGCFHAVHEGSEFTIIDAQKSRGGAATFADVVAGSGTSHYKVRFNGAMVI
jgi:hypothetical protein